MTPRTITVTGSFVEMTTSTSRTSEHSQWWVVLFTFRFWQKFFSSGKEISWFVAWGCLSLHSSVASLLSLLSIVALFMKNYSWVHKLVPGVFMDIVTNKLFINIQLAGQGPDEIARVFIDHVLKLPEEFWCPNGILSSLVGLTGKWENVLLLPDSYPFKSFFFVW